MKEVIKITDWELDEDLKIKYSKDNKEATIINKNNTKKSIKFNRTIYLKNKKNINQCLIKFWGEVENSGGYIQINNEHNIPINSDNLINIKTAEKLDFKLFIAANSSITIKDVEIDFLEEKMDLIDELDKEANVLVIVPEYPNYVNLYNCAFAHSRNKEYVKKGLKVQVFAVNPLIWYQTKYTRDNVPVIKGSYQDLKNLLSKHQYDVVVTHFVDEYLYPIFDGNIYNNQKLIFICHGPETVYRYLVNKCRNYFTPAYKEPIQNESFDLKDYYVKKYANKDNVEWVFVSDWLKEFSEEQQNLKFKNARVINNIIDQNLFPYKKKNQDLRKKILVIRKFDNICQHSIDQIVLAIRELSRRDFFKDLEFDIYGDGGYYDELIAPIKDLKNVNLYKRFIPNEKLNEIYAEHGIMMLPSRHDAHAVSMGEAASSGLVVVGSRVTSNPYFMNEKENHTLSDPEDYVELANIIERLYKNPKEFTKISENMAKFTSQFKKENTVFKEVELIEESIKSVKNKETFEDIKKAEKPILTIGVPAYNVEKYIEKCLVSILNARNSNKIEVLVINDGSKDKTAEITREYEKKSKGIIRLIDKENGGHGSTINVAIKEAKGKYFRLIDSDDWVDPENLAKLVDIMEKEESDIILTKGSYDYIEEAQLVNIINYDNLNEGTTYNFEDLTYENYGFKVYGPLLTTGNYKTEVLQKTKFTISEKKPYVDMEFNAFSIRDMQTLTYYDLNIYRYLIGREGQTISKEFWQKKYKDHEYIIFNILEKVYSDKKYTDGKLLYILRNIISQMVDSQIFMFDSLCKWKELDTFIEKLKKYKDAYEYSIKTIKEKDGNCWLILNMYKKKMNIKSTESIIIPGVREKLSDVYANSNVKNRSFKQTIKKVIKAITPYGLIYYRRKLKKY